jgi:hypothetical protein
MYKKLLGETDSDYKEARFNHTCDTIRRNLKHKTRTDAQPTFYKMMAVTSGLTAVKQQEQVLRATEIRVLRSIVVAKWERTEN